MWKIANKIYLLAWLHTQVPNSDAATAQEKETSSNVMGRGNYYFNI